MEIDDSESIQREDDAAVELLDRLLETADGGRSVGLGEFEASTLLALLIDKRYRVKIMSRLDDFANMDTRD